jgi:hypothetical protein
MHDASLCVQWRWYLAAQNAQMWSLPGWEAAKLQEPELKAEHGDEFEARGTTGAKGAKGRAGPLAEV